MDADEKSKGEASIFVKIFKALMGVGMFGAMANYILFGPKGFKIPKYQNM